MVLDFNERNAMMQGREDGILVQRNAAVPLTYT